MTHNGLKNELSGLRGITAYKRLKLLFANAVGRADLYGHLALSVETALSVHKKRNRPLTYYEFGTGSGNTLERALDALKKFKGGRAFLFDSFEGLPAMQHKSDASPLWKQGDFSFSQNYISRIVKKSGFDSENVRFIKGFYETSLTLELQKELANSPPAFVTIDVDYYSSTKIVLDFLKPILASGCIIFFDDLWAFDGHPEYGQLKALNEFNLSNSDGQLVPHQVLGNRMYSYYRSEYEFLSEFKRPT